jgi:hypothetical protein
LVDDLLKLNPTLTGNAALERLGIDSDVMLLDLDGGAEAVEGRENV